MSYEYYMRALYQTKIQKKNTQPLIYYFYFILFVYVIACHDDVIGKFFYTHIICGIYGLRRLSLQSATQLSAKHKIQHLQYYNIVFHFVVD